MGEAKQKQAQREREAQVGLLGPNIPQNTEQSQTKLRPEDQVVPAEDLNMISVNNPHGPIPFRPGEPLPQELQPGMKQSELRPATDQLAVYPKSQSHEDSMQFGYTAPPEEHRTPDPANPPQAPAAPRRAAARSGGGGVKMLMQKDYWPAEQPEQTEEDVILGIHRETRWRAGTVQDVSAGEAMDLLEKGIATRFREVTRG